MIASRVLLNLATMFWLTGNLDAQEASLLRQTLPAESKAIETAEVPVDGGISRTLVLWMLHPTRVTNQRQAGSEIFYGDHWYGPTRLSLVDLPNNRLINTIEIHGPGEHAGDDEDGFSIPFHATNQYYYVPHLDEHKEGTPKVLNLRDLTGEGIAGQFVLFDYVNSGTAATAVLGYSRKLDAAIQYQIQVTDEKTKLESWATHLFGEKPIRPGFWDFDWEPGYGDNSTIHESIYFDPAKQTFVERRTVTPYPVAGPKKKPSKPD